MVGVAENLIISGAFSINQRTYVSGTALTATKYAHDRWKAGASGCTYTFGSAADTINITTGTLQQVIEGVNNPGGTVTLTWSGTAQCRVNGGAYSSSPLEVTGLTVGQNITVEFNTGTVSRVQCSAGSVPFTFNRRSYADELSLCQRYYQSQKNANITSSYVATGDAHVTWFMKTTMRAAPTVGLDGGNGAVYSSTPDSVDVKLTVGGAQNYAVIVNITCDAEL